MTIENENILNFAHSLADAATKAILPFFRNNHHVENKCQTGFDPVTEADKAAEAAMREVINNNRPNDGIIGEEYSEKIGNSGWTWILDPIDGTRAFMAGTSTWGVLIAAYYENQPKIGIIAQPFIGERFVSNGINSQWQNNGAVKTIQTNKNATINNSILSTTDPFMFNDSEFTLFNEIRKIAPVTRYGLDCTAYGLLAQGGIGLVVECSLKIFDIAALIPVVENAGGIFTDWHGNKNPTSGNVIAAANPQIHTEALEILSKI